MVGYGITILASSKRVSAALFSVKVNISHAPGVIYVLPSIVITGSGRDFFHELVHEDSIDEYVLLDINTLFVTPSAYAPNDATAVLMICSLLHRSIMFSVLYLTGTVMLRDGSVSLQSAPLS
ncbi:MAG: hypothetical protein H6766_05395 [Candidatus Peribacteria bacterium]|nr:MAG: hypothetical protein H6766_05395 [Candidatus Peribacteria bacterium]